MMLVSLMELGGFEQHLVRAFDATAVFPVVLLIAAGVGAVHGLTPGHGKTLAASYLVGTHARRRHAVALAGIVATMHTASVLALGLLWWVAIGSGSAPIEATTRWAQLAVALVVLVVGAAITRRRWRDCNSPHHHGHAHLGPESSPAAAMSSWPGLAGIAFAGGLLPSPSAFIVLISGMLTGRLVFALSLIVAFGFGLASTVLATGLVAVAGRDWIKIRGSAHSRLGRAYARIPLVAAVGVLTGGCLLSIIAVNGLLGS